MTITKGMIYLISFYVARKCHRGDLGVISFKTLSIMGVLVTKDGVQIWNHATLLQASQHRTLWWFMCFYIRLVSLLFIKWLLGLQIATIRIPVLIHGRRPLSGCQRVEIPMPEAFGGKCGWRNEIVNLQFTSGRLLTSWVVLQTKIGSNEDFFRQD